MAYPGGVYFKISPKEAAHIKRNNSYQKKSDRGAGWLQKV